VDERLIFAIGPPRSGSTLLARMVGAHSQVFAPAEPHLLTPLAHLGYYDRVESAAYDPVISQAAARELVAGLPGGERDYLAALRAYADTIYERLLAGSGRRWLLDKTPAYALVLDFVATLYPKARYLVLTRNPLAVWSSYVESFFDGDAAAAHRFNPLLERYVPAIARFLREAPVAIQRVRYEELVADPEARMREVCGFLGLDFEAAMVDYGEAGRRAAAARGLGDPVTVARETRPTTRSLARFVEEMAGNAAKVQLAREILARLPDPDLETWGFPRADLEAQLAAVPAQGPRRERARLTRYALERRLLVRLRRNIHRNAFGRLVRRVRTVCDVLLR
jgi:hypothetical protein